MNPNMPQDELLERYEQAKAEQPDGLPNQPSAALRERIMQTAREQVNAMNKVAPRADSMPATGQKSFRNTVANEIQSTEAANDSFWNIKAVAGIAVMGLSALIWWQFEQGTTDEQVAAKTAQPNPAVVAIAPPASPAPAAPMATSAASEAVATTAKEEAIVQAPRVEKRSAAVTPAQVAAEPNRPVAEMAVTAPAAPTPSEVERARNQDVVDASPANRTLSAEAPGTMSAPPAMARPSVAPPVAAAPAARAAAPAPVAASAPMNPLLLALQTRDAAALRQALTQGASPNALTRDGSPALTQAVSQRWAEGVRILLAAGADKQAKNNKGHTAADVAFELSYEDMSRLLEEPR